MGDVQMTADAARQARIERAEAIAARGLCVLHCGERWVELNQRAGMLAEHADRDELAASARRQMLNTSLHADALRERAERAEDEAAELREKWLAFTSRLEFGDNKTERAAELAEMVDPIEQAFSDAGDHAECAVACELCGERLAATVCDECQGSGCLPNSALAYLECGMCAGAGKVHDGCVEKSYAELASEVAELQALIRDGLDHWGGVLSPYWLTKLSEASKRAALDPEGGQS